tara:strand:- start:525 stop:1130 length:606 start_codon:yes stop_codon:yes gene_type:complete
MTFPYDKISNLVIYLNNDFGIIIFILIYILAIIFILPASWLSLLSGYLYGSYKGSFIVFISAFIGASISFFIAKNFFSDMFRKLIIKYKKFIIIESLIEKGGLKLIILTRLSPLFPFSILNYFYGLNGINYKDFSISLLCIIPGTFLYTSFGSLAKDIQDLNNIKSNPNFLLNSIAIISTILLVYFLAKYANDFFKETKIS